MGIIDNLRNLFKGSDKTPVVQEEDKLKKATLAREIVNLVNEIKKINSFDSCVWNLSNVTTSDLMRRSLTELEQIHSSLNSRLSELTRQSQRSNPKQEALEYARWTGQKPKNFTDHEFDRFQRDDER